VREEKRTASVKSNQRKEKKTKNKDMQQEKEDLLKME
jgi:hypothetical protein